MGELTLALVGDEDALDWVDIEETRVGVHAKAMHFLHSSLQPLDWEETGVGLLQGSVRFHFLDDVIQLILISQVDLHEDLETKLLVSEIYFGLFELGETFFLLDFGVRVLVFDIGHIGCTYHSEAVVLGLVLQVLGSNT